jgi:hypothetical protein
VGRDNFVNTVTRYECGGGVDFPYPRLGVDKWRSQEIFRLGGGLTFRNPASYIQDGTPLPSTHPIFYSFSTNTRNEFFKHVAHSPFLSLQNGVYFIMLPFFGSCIIHILHTGCAKKIKKFRVPKG